MLRVSSLMGIWIQMLTGARSELHYFTIKREREHIAIAGMTHEDVTRKYIVVQEVVIYLICTQ